MHGAYLEVTFGAGKPLAAYFYLPKPNVPVAVWKSARPDCLLIWAKMGNRLESRSQFLPS